MFITRTISGIVLLAVTMCAIIASGPLLYLFMLLISLVGMYELYRVFQMEKKIPAIVGYLTSIGIESVILAGKNDLVVLILVLGFLAMMVSYVATYPKFTAEEIAKEDSKDAFSGDRVLVKLKKKSNGARQEGIILKVIEHKKDTLVGTFRKNKNFGFVIPDDKKLCRDIFISKKNFGKARNNHKVLVQITKYPQKGKKAEGKILEVIGNVNEAGIDMLSLIKDYDLPYRFPKDVVKEAQKFGDKINPNDIAD